MDAVQLKNEHMVKLPVIVYNRDSQSEVLIDAIDLRNKLEEIADAEYAKTGEYIRPIALFQAQPKGKEDATTFENCGISWWTRESPLSKLPFVPPM